MRKKFSALIEENKWLKGVPTTLTIGNSLCGFGAILYTLHVYSAASKDVVPSVLALSSCIILAAMIFDALDGFAARLFHAASMHGMQMDSLADMVTFGVAPAVVVAVMAHKLRDLQGNSFYFVWIMCAVYLGCAALRLATYNVHAIQKKKSSEKFNGLPSPGAAAAICSIVILFNYYSKAQSYPVEYYHLSHEQSFIVKFLPLYAGILGLLMVSKVKYTHMGKWLQSVRRNYRRLIIFLIFLGLLVFTNPIVVLTFAINVYVLSGPLGSLLKMFSKSKKFETELKTSG